MTNRLHGLLVDPGACFPPPPSTACSFLPQGCLRIQESCWSSSQNDTWGKAKSSPKSYDCFLKTAFLEFQHRTCSNSLLQNLVIWFYRATGGVGICGNLLRANIWISVPKAASTLNTIQQLSGEKLMLDLGLEKDLIWTPNYNLHVLL